MMRLGCFLARYGRVGSDGRSRPPEEFGSVSWRSAYLSAFDSLGDGRTEKQFLNALKNTRDEFDGHFDNGRTGWRLSTPQREAKPIAPAMKPAFDESMALSREANWKLVAGPLDLPAGSSKTVGSGQRLELTMVTGAADVTAAFADWRKAILEEAGPDGKIRWVAGENIAFAGIGARAGEVPGAKIKLGVDPDGEDWAVQINEPANPETEDSLSGVGIAGNGRRYLLRQGRLQANNQSAGLIEADFAKRTGLQRVDVRIGGLRSSRDWYVVAPLDEGAPVIRSRTARFVDRCAAARTWPAAHLKDDIKRLEDLFGVDERGGWSRVWVPPGDRMVLRRQGEVWIRLNAVLKKHGIELTKPRHADGYEVDGEIVTKDGPLLLEIKSDTSAASVYGGIGQLVLYPQMLKRLAGHARILLLPGEPRPALVSAIKACGVELHVFDMKVSGKNIAVSFSPAFLARCGVPAD